MSQNIVYCLVVHGVAISMDENVIKTDLMNTYTGVDNVRRLFFEENHQSPKRSIEVDFTSAVDARKILRDGNIVINGICRRVYPKRKPIYGRSFYRTPPSKNREERITKPISEQDILNIFEQQKQHLLNQNLHKIVEEQIDSKNISMYKNDYQNGSIDVLRSKHRNTSLEDDFKVHLMNSEVFYQNTIDDDYEVEEDEEGFTDLRVCEEPVDSDSELSRSSSPVVIEDDQPKKISCSSFSEQSQSETSSADSFKSSYVKSYDELLNLIYQDPYKFICKPVSKDMTKYLHCRLSREKSLLSEIYYLQVEFGNDDEPITLLTAEKGRKSLGQSQYTISLDSSFACDLCPAELVANNVTGTEYILYTYSEDQRQEQAVILYESNFLGLKGPRKANVILPKFDNQMQPLFNKNEIDEFCAEDLDDDFLHLYNTAPSWNPLSGAYTIHFEGIDRITIPSVKNFQMFALDKNNQEQTVMEFGRMTDTIFSCDFRYPLSFIQAFSIALTAFETRLFRE
ncbi:unnamed protein product [Adineta ricciae]|uniref:Tubby C-terminal domain-containing protein n=1 Tax=Adineta ricciae TaxID=249248 RepID=A0A814QC12_ADIRI|nr:unnamed protein product [Adineta ricciae]